MNKNIWAELKNNKENFVELKKPSHQTECKRLIDHSISLIKSVFNRSVSFNSISKTTIGYSLQLQCSKRSPDCSSCWSIKIKVAKNELNVICDQSCAHLLVSAADSSKLNFLKMFKFLFVNNLKKRFFIHREYSN